ncbi:hypothetical protein [Halegenticoccus tardaugens]|uniref:hypothetical protein n=1 Tax=Halegenticoccus tardaugens TaxID=2071624 RepID=UPI00100AFD40|nr:hypothetical protein [Halegenticoccus tardaugens]
MATSIIPPAAPTRFDLILLLVGAILFAGGAVGLLSAIPLYVAGGVSSLAAGAALFEGLVRNPPRE